MGALRIILTVIYILICIALVVLVLMQEGKTAGLGAISGAAETYWGKNKGRSMEDHDGACGRVHGTGGCFESNVILKQKERKALLHGCGEGAFIIIGNEYDRHTI